MKKESGARSAQKVASAVCAIVEKMGAVKNMPTFLEAAEKFLPMYRGNPTLQGFLENPLVPKDAKKAFIDKALTSSLPEVLCNMLKVVVDHQMEKEMGEIFSSFIQMGHEVMDRVPVQVTTAIPLTADLEKILKTKLKEKLHKEVVLRPLVDPKVIGGIRIVWNGEELDGTIPARLHRLEKYLLGGVV